MTMRFTPTWTAAYSVIGPWLAPMSIHMTEPSLVGPDWTWTTISLRFEMATHSAIDSLAFCASQK
jgi:hypothetical protein